MRPWTGPGFLAPSLAALAIACASEPLDDQSASGGGGTAGSSPTCDEPPGYPTSAEQQLVGTVDAMLVDLEGTPRSDVMVQVCGLDVCISGMVMEGGLASTTVGSMMTLPAFKYGDGYKYGRVALLLPSPTEAVDLGTVSVPPLPSAGAAISAGAVTSSGGVALELDANAGVTFDRLTYRTADEQAFRATELPVDQAPAGLDPGLGFETYFALGPPDTEFCPPATLVVPNSLGLSPGDEVEFFLHGLDVEERYAPYGGFTKFASGTVSDDGLTIRSSERSLPLLSLVAIKRR